MPMRCTQIFVNAAHRRILTPEQRERKRKRDHERRLTPEQRERKLQSKRQYRKTPKYLSHVRQYRQTPKFKKRKRESNLRYRQMQRETAWAAHWFLLIHFPEDLQL
jgi:hypothetical protein